MFSLLLKRHFYPLFWVQFLGAFNDNLFKNALVMLITFKLSESVEETGLLITMAAGLFILPFFLFSSFAGQIADKHSKSRLIKKIKLAEILIMLTGAVALIQVELELLLVTLFLMGAQSAFFGPIKYSILPEILTKQELVKGNSLFSGSTFIAILLGTLFGGLGVLMDNGLYVMATAIVGVSILGYLLSFRLVQTGSADADLVVEWNVFRSTWRLIDQARQHRVALFSILGISWFWFIGATLLSQIPTLVKYDLFATDKVATVLLTLFSIGIAVGSGLTGQLMKSKVHIRWHWFLLLLMSLFLILTVVSINQSEAYLVSRETPVGFLELMSLWPLNLTLIWLCLLAIVGGLYIVPLYTLLQTNTPFLVRARMIAVNNIVNAMLMVISAVTLMIGFSISLSLIEMLFTLGLINLLISSWFFSKRNLQGS